MDCFDLAREDGSFIENEFQNNKSEYLGVIFSGLGYSYKSPLLYYTRNLLLENKIDYFGIDFGYSKNKNFLALNRETRVKYFEDDNEIIIRKILELGSHYKKILLIGKSLGTSAVRQCLKRDLLRIKAGMILLTPSNEWAQFIEEIKTLENKFLIIGSLADKLFTAKNLPEIYKKKNIIIYELKNADHSLEVNNTIENIEQLKTLMKLIKKYTGRLVKIWDHEPKLPLLLENLNN